MRGEKDVETMIFGLMSDIHIVNKPYRLTSALRELRDVDVLLLAGDIVNDGKAEQYALVQKTFDGYPGYVPVFTVSGNHDIPGNDESNYRAFERAMLRRSESRYDVTQDPCGAIYVKFNENLDLVGLNPLYHQKMFRFPSNGEQLIFLEDHLTKSTCKNHIILCHPPLVAHNPQRGRMYLPAKQDARLQQIVDEHPRVLFISGHTHLFPEIEPEDPYGNIYINDGSVCPTQSKGACIETFPGNVMLFDAEDTFTGIKTVFHGKIGRNLTAPHGLTP